jgi:N-acetylneuraminate lyase
MHQKRFELIAAPFTAFNADGSLNLAMIERQANALVDAGVSGAFVCGTTGEGVSLTTRERMQVAERWMAVAPSTLRIMIHVGHQSVSESRALAAHAEKIKACAFATIAPTFFRVTNTEQLVNYCAEVSSGAPGLPFYYYHMPAMTGADLPMFDFLTVASKRIPNLAGIKFTHENLMDYSRCLNFEGGRFNILFGRDEILLAALLMGATGAVGSTYNFMAPVYHRVIDAVNAGDLEAARKFQSKAVEIIAVLIRRGTMASGKSMMKMIGLDCGPVRPPLQNLSPEAVEALARELKAVGFPVSAESNKAPGKSGATGRGRSTMACTPSYSGDARSL